MFNKMYYYQVIRDIFSINNYLSELNVLYLGYGANIPYTTQSATIVQVAQNIDNPLADTITICSKPIDFLKESAASFSNTILLSAFLNSSAVSKVSPAPLSSASLL